jgi:hypothetical protein
MNAMFSFGLDECMDDALVCKIGRESAHAKLLFESHLIVTDDMACAIERASRVLVWTANSHELFGGVKMLFVGVFCRFPSCPESRNVRCTKINCEVSVLA